jgi:hypothetical protein
MFSNIYTPEPAAVLRLSNGDEVKLAFVVEGGWKKLRFIFAVERSDGTWLGFDVRQIPALGDPFTGVSSADDSRLRALGEAMRSVFGSSEQLAWAVAGVADTFYAARSPAS